MSDNYDLRGKIDQAKRRLPLPELMAQVALGDRAKKTAHCLPSVNSICLTRP